METYKSWQVYSSLPTGWQIDKTTDAPKGYFVFITNGKSPLHEGYQRALLKIEAPTPIPIISNTKSYSKQPIKVGDNTQPYPAKEVNMLARERMKLKLMNDIRIDLEICKLEGWDKTEYLNEIKELINSINN